MRVLRNAYSEIFHEELSDVESRSISEQDRLAYILCGGDKTKFQNVKDMQLEDVYKNIFLMNEEVDRLKTSQQSE